MNLERISIGHNSPIYEDVYIAGDKNMDHSFGTVGLDAVSWGGAAGTYWYYIPEDDLAFSFQTNVVEAGNVGYLSDNILGLLQDHSF